MCGINNRLSITYDLKSENNESSTVKRGSVLEFKVKKEEQIKSSGLSEDRQK